jgi:hypothetical protein
MYTKHGMVSVVCCLDESGEIQDHLLIVRSRTFQDLSDVLEEGGFTERRNSILYTPRSDYAFRIKMLKTEVMHLVQKITRDIDYDNFKNACHDDPDKKRMLTATWQAAVTYQSRKGH